MSFSLRHVTQRAGGGDDIVRTSSLPDKPVIGRGQDCDIRLPDLAVELRHARLRQAGHGRVIVEALGQADFRSGGMAVTQVELSVTNAPRLAFGHHVVTLSVGGAPEEIVVTVAAEAGRQAALGDHHDPFALRSAIFGLRRSAWLLGLAILLACLAVPVGIFLYADNPRLLALGADRQWSSGPLSPGHHFLEKNCAACHQQPFVKVRDSACLACHRAGQDGKAALQLATDLKVLGSPFAAEPAGDHASPERLDRARPTAPEFTRRVQAWLTRTFSHPERDCVACHNEHVGSGTPPAAALPAPVTADHLRGEDCKDCHSGMRQRLSDTVLPDISDWSNHADFRPLLRLDQAKVERTALQPGVQEKSGLNFSHRLHLSASGGVARMATALGKAPGYGAPLTCANCHRPDAGGEGFLPVQMTRDCAQCHSLAFAMRGGRPQLLPHGRPEGVVAALQAFYGSAPAMPPPERANVPRRPGLAGERRSVRTVAVSGADMAAGAVRAAFSAGGACFGCHAIRNGTSSPAFAVAPVRLAGRYLPHGGFNHAIPAHRQDARGAPTCIACHKAESSARAEDVLLPHIADCAACHGRSKTQTPTAASADCGTCHSFHDTAQPARWRRAVFAAGP